MAIKVEVFTSPTCPHCPGAKQVVAQAKEELGDAIDVIQFDIAEEEGRQKAINYGIMAVPAIAINDEVKFVGAPSLAQLMNELK
ncbi:MJ0307 family thioredoxin [uncultured Methanobrevibacter sp.]|uniref:MJ0307 family thioredoxin n=1 Tax=uncultured Methanobrevibacter sp. TaxID=253161 RepID=UPI00260CCB15